MKKIVVLNKKEGETPLQALENFRSKNKKYKNLKMTYAGRLDPLVSGLLLVLVGDSVREKEKYLGLPKEYKFEILFGFGTDTHDILGKVTGSKPGTHVDSEDLKKSMQFFVGIFKQKYPLYSSPTIKQARRGRSVPTAEHAVEIKHLRFLGLRKVSGRTLMKNIETRIGRVEGDFRQKDILKIWQKQLKRMKDEQFYLGSFYVRCGSGMYVRMLAHDVGQKLQAPALAWKIQRTKIGKFAKIT